MNVRQQTNLKEYQKFKKILHQYSDIYMYGAGVVAFGAYKAIKSLFNVTINKFVVTEKNGQSKEIDGIPVLTLEEIQINTKESFVIIATPEEYHNSIEQLLKKRKVLHYLKLTSHVEYMLMGSYLKKICNINLIEDYEPIDNFEKRDSLGVYMAVSHQDKILKKAYKEKFWVRKIQVGAALTDVQICELTDIEEDSISDKNELYGELSAAYYAWKYGEYNITGLFHYRRILDVTEGQMGLLEKGTLDAILPLPFVCNPDASGQYRRYLSRSDINIMLNVIKEMEREHYQEISDILSMPYLYNYNMLIARREVYENYCEWLFPLLEEITRRCEKEKRERLPRYIGRIGEILTSVYFMRNEKQWKIAHAEKVWRV